MDPAFIRNPVPARLLTAAEDQDAAGGATATLTPLAGPAALVTALAPDGLRLRRLLDRGYGQAQAHIGGRPPTGPVRA